MSDLYAYADQGKKTLGSATVDSSGRITWNPSAPDLSQCDALQIVEQEQTAKQLTVWFAVDRGSVSLNSNNFPTFTITTPLCALSLATLSYSARSWNFVAIVEQQRVPFTFPADNTGPLPAPVSPSLQFTANLSSTPSNMKLDVPNQAPPWSVTIGFVAMPTDRTQWALFVSTTAVGLAGDFWKDLGSGGPITLAFTYLPGLTAINPGPIYSRAFVELSGFSNTALSAYWNNQIALSYLVSVPTAEPDAPISVIWTIPPNAGPWIYRTYISNLGIDAGGDLVVAWQPGCFTLTDGASIGFSMPNLFEHGGSALQGVATLLLTTPEDFTDQLAKQVSAYATAIRFFAFRISAVQLNASQSVRLGALDLTFSAAVTPIPDQPWHILGYVEPSLNQNLSQFSHPRVIVRDLRLAIDTVQVGSEDPLPNQTGESPVIIPLNTPPSVHYTLVIAESNPRGQQRTLTLTLMQPQGNGGNASLLILDRNPFLVARINMPSLLGSGTAATTAVAEWSNTYPYGEGWHSQSGAQTFTVLLPPQGIGEAIERSRDILPGSTVDYRFSPPAQVEIAPPVLAGTTENYFEAPWNLRRLLASPGQNVPGSPTPSFAAEFAYGLPVTVTSQDLRFAEITALTGRLAAPLTLGQPMADAWNQTLAAFQTRLSVLVPWDGQQPGSLTLSDQVQYRLRANADLAYPAPPTTQPAGTAPYPAFEDGLKGGIAWIFDSENIYRGIWQQPQTTFALLADPAFSALGGWAKQRAVFLNGVTAINSHVEMGRVSTISVEQIGRIGVLWNHAKLVTVYERTVQPSDQFSDSQDPLLGQPIVRKVLEYVEILQPSRSYPESGAGAINVACVQGSEFKSKVIYVDSSWGSDVPGGGWQVPLWRPNANPSVYVKPHIILNVAADPDTGNGTQSQEIDEPQKLVFYTTENAGADPDLWPSALGVDYADVDTRVQNSIQLTSQNYRLAIQPGMGAFTWALAASAFPTNVVAARTTASSINATLTNVSMMRSKAALQPGQIAAGQPPLLALHQVSDHASSLIQEIASNLSLGNLQTVVKNRVLQPYLDQLSTIAATAMPQGNLKAALQLVLTAASGNYQQLTANAADIFASIVETIQNAVTAGAANIADIAKQQTILLNSLLGNLDPGILGNALQSAQQDLNKIAAATPTSAQITNSFQPGANPTTLELLQALQTVIIQSLPAVALDLDPLLAIGGGNFLPGWLQSATIEARLAQPIADLINGVIDVTKPAGQAEVQGALTDLAGDIAAFTHALTALQNLPILNLDPATLVSHATTLAGIANLQDAKNWLQAVASPDAIAKSVTTAGNNLIAWVQTNSTSWIASAAAPIQKALDTLASNFANQLLARANISGWPAFGQQLAGFQTQLQSRLGSFLALGTHLANTVQTAQASYYSVADQALSLFRAYGAAPVAPGLSFAQGQLALDQLAYFFDTANPTVAITNGVQSALNAAAQAVPDLLPVNLNVPIQSLLDRLLPDPTLLAQNAISDIFENLAGMDLSSLFSGLFPPLNAPDGIQIRHSINPQTLQVEVDADIDIKFANDTTVLDAGPILLRLLNAEFRASVKIEAQAGRQPVEQVTGTISGDWELQIAGLSLVTFVNTSLTFDQSGHIRFDVSPEKVQLASIMQFIADLVNSIGSPGSGLSIRFTPSPVAVVSNLDLPLPDIAGGVFALSNVRLGALFSIGLDSHNNFQFIVGMNLSREDAPFAIVIFILGGGGWVDAQLTYTIGGAPQVTVTVGISAIAALEIALGPISGGVMISFSLYATYSTGSSLDLGIVICVAGHVSLLGIVEADITLLLEADYDAGQLTGRGSVSVDIQICWCFTLSIHQEVEYQFGNRGGAASQPALHAGFAAILGPGTLTAQPDPYWAAASQYIDMLAA